MLVIDNIVDLRAALGKQAGRVGFVPTMGYLHAGHVALVKHARAAADLVVASIYVNPTQFAPTEDLATYPRDLDGDARKLEEAGCDLLFTPKNGEIYPEGYATYITVGDVTDRYEGAFRPDHFRGVATVVAKLFNIVSPDIAVFGQKDAQQVAVIRKMIRDLNYGIELVVVDTVREPDGLAMSSRNVYLSEEDRREAISISQALLAARETLAGGGTVGEATERMRGTLSKAIELDYADIIDPETFREARDGDSPLLGIIAGRIGRTRLIDNMRLE